LIGKNGHIQSKLIEVQQQSNETAVLLSISKELLENHVFLVVEYLNF